MVSRAEIQAARAKARKEATAKPSAIPDASVKAVEKIEETVTEEVVERRIPQIDEAEEDKRNVDAEMSMGGTSISITEETEEDVTLPPRKKVEPEEVTEAGSEPEEKPKKKKARKVKTKKLRSTTAQIRDFPRELLDIARKEFPTATTASDALAAFVLAKSGGTSENVPAHIVDLVRDWDGDRSMLDMNARVASVEHAVREIRKSTSLLELGLSYLIFDFDGFREQAPKGPSDIDFLDVGAQEVLERLSAQHRQHAKRKRVKDGRPL